MKTFVQKYVKLSKFYQYVHKSSPFINSRRRYMAEILPVRRKTLYNQSINVHIYVLISFEIHRWCLLFFVDVELVKFIHHQIIYRDT